MKPIILSGGAISAILLELLCATGPPQQADPRDVSFADDVQPIFAQWCAGCHSPGGSADRAGIQLQLTPDVAYARLVGQASTQAPDRILVDPGRPEDSLLLRKVADRQPPVGGRMPPLFFPPLADDDAATLRAWIAEGALDN